MFLLVRHPSYDVSTGHLDELGISQTEQLADLIEAIPFDFKRIISSPSTRTKEMTAQLVKRMGVMWQEDATLAVDGFPKAYLPPRDLSTLIIISHQPTLQKLIQAWASAFGCVTPPSLEVGQAYLVDIKTRTFRLLTAQQS